MAESDFIRTFALFKQIKTTQIMALKYCCPHCGETLKQGEYYYDMESDTMRVEHCSNNCETEGEKCVPIDAAPEPEQSEYNDLGIDIRTGTPWGQPDMDYEH